MVNPVKSAEIVCEISPETSAVRGKVTLMIVVNTSEGNRCHTSVTLRINRRKKKGCQSLGTLQKAHMGGHQRCSDT